MLVTVALTPTSAGRLRPRGSLRVSLHGSSRPATSARKFGKAELRSAHAALAILRNGGYYRLVLGKSITPEQITDRREALEQEARDLGIASIEAQFEVLNGDSMPRWAEEFPAVASSPAIRGVGIIGQTFDDWSNSVVHRTAWIPSEARTNQINDLRLAITEGNELGVHVQGVSGLGNTRLVMESLKDRKARHWLYTCQARISLIQLS